MDLLEELAKFGTGRRMPNDTFFAEGDAICKPWTRLGVVEFDDEELCHSVVAKFPCDAPGCTLTFDSLLQYELHYNSSHRYFCKECKKRLPSPHILELHVLETHDSFFKAQAERKPMYACYIEECPLKFTGVQQRHEHCITDHQFPPDYRFDDFRKQNAKKKESIRNKKGSCVLKMDVDSSETKEEIKEISRRKKKNKQKKLESTTMEMDSQEQIECQITEKQKGKSNENFMKQKKDSIQDQKTEPHVKTDNEKMGECNSIHVAENIENSMKEKHMYQKKTGKAPLQVFTFGRGGRGGRFIPWHKSAAHKNTSDAKTETQIWESSDLRTALNESVMDS